MRGIGRARGAGLGILLLALTGGAPGQESGIRQEYRRPPDGDPVVKNGRQSTKWAAKRNPGGLVYYESIYTATDADGNVVNKQRVWYFPNPPQGELTDKSNHWVYWYNEKTGAIWARCPTPRHPMYRQWQQQEGADLWQVAEKKVPGQLDVNRLAANFGPTFSTAKTGLPKVVMGAPTPIDCVDFDDTAFN